MRLSVEPTYWMQQTRRLHAWNQDTTLGFNGFNKGFKYENLPEIWGLLVCSGGRTPRIQCEGWVNELVEIQSRNQKADFPIHSGSQKIEIVKVGPRLTRLGKESLQSPKHSNHPGNRPLTLCCNFSEWLLVTTGHKWVKSRSYVATRSTSIGSEMSINFSEHLTPKLCAKDDVYATSCKV